MTAIYECHTLKLANNGRVGGLVEITENADGSAVVVQLQLVPGTNDTQWQRHESLFTPSLWTSLKSTVLSGLIRVGSR